MSASPQSPESLLQYASEFVFTPTGTIRNMDTRHFQIHVKWRGEGQWSVHHWDECWNGEDWEYEPTPSHRDNAFTHIIARARFTLDDACAAAQRLADGIVTKDLPWTQWKARLKKMRGTGSTW